MLLLVLVLAVDPPQDRPGLRITPDLATTARGADAAARGVAVEPYRVLADPSIEEAVRSGLPLRMRFRVELWRDRFIAELIGQQRWGAVLLFDPLERDFLVRSEDTPDAATRRYPTFAAARRALEASVGLSLAPRESGRYYYTAVLDMETLSLSDLEELERWLRGELRPAVSGDRAVGGAVSQGARRLMIRVLRLPTRRFETRSDRFTVG